MASSTLPSWTPENKDELRIVNKSEQSRKLLTKNMVDLAKNVQMSALWPYLRQMEVLDQDTEAHLKQGPNQEQMAKMIDWLLRNPKWKLNAFIRALCLSQQEYIVSEILHLNPEDFNREEASPVSRQPSTQTGSRPALPQELQEAIKTQSNYYARSMMTGHLFDLKELGIPYDINDFYIQVAASEDGYLGAPKDILPEKILVVEPGNPELRTALLSGSAGSGKSTTVRKIAYRWSTQKEEERDWDLIIILNVSSLKLTKGASTHDKVREAIHQSLVGNEEKDEIMKNLDNKKLRMLIVTDGLEGCCDNEVLQMVKDLVDQTHKGNLNFTVLVTCRSGLSPISDNLFDQRMKVNGFTLDEGIQYVKNFYTNSHKSLDDTPFSYIVDNKNRLEHILTNPMFTHILSVVTSNGMLKPTKGQTLGLKDILQALVKTMTKREVEKNESVQEDQEEMNMEAQIAKFYKMCLFVLLKGIRPIDESLLTRFDIDRRNPLLSFLELRNTYNDEYEKVSQWHFTHEVFLEYFSTCALEMLPGEALEHVLLLLCYKREFCNVQRLLFSTLWREADQLHKLSNMMQATLLLQSKLGGQETEEVRGQIHGMQERVKSLMDIDSSLQILLPTSEPGQEESLALTHEVSKKTKTLWGDISCFFSDNRDELKRGGLFLGISADIEMMKHIVECLREVPEELQEELFNKCVRCLLPSRCEDGSGTCQTLYATGHLRWSVIQEDDKGVRLQTSCLSDACQAIGLHKERCHQSHSELAAGRGHSQEPLLNGSIKGDKQVKEITLEFPPIFRHLWAPPSQAATKKWEPLDQFSNPEAWTSFLGELLQFGVRADQLNVQWNQTYNVSAIGLLNCLLLKDTQNHLKNVLTEHEGWLDIRLDCGQIDVKNLSEWTTCYLKQNRVCIELREFICNNPSSHPLQTDFGTELHNTVHGGCRLFSGLVMSTPGGAVAWFRTACVTEASKSSASSEVEPQHVQDKSSKQRSDIKIVAVGDGACGKTCLLLRFCRGQFPEEYYPTVFDNYATDTKVDAQQCHLGLWDTAGQEDYDRLRPLSYPETDIFLICYAIDGPGSWENVYAKWYYEVRHHCPRAPLVVVGCKADLRNDPQTIDCLKGLRMAPITIKQGQEVAERIGACDYLECSALTGEGVRELFAAVSRIVLSEADTSKAKKKTGKCCCLI